MQNIAPLLLVSNAGDKLGHTVLVSRSPVEGCQRVRGDWSSGRRKAACSPPARVCTGTSSLLALAAHVNQRLKSCSKCTFCRSDKKKIGVVLICSRWMAIVMLAVVAFSPSKSKGEEVGPLTGQSGSTRFESPCCALAESGWSTRITTRSEPPTSPARGCLSPFGRSA